jgi:Zn-dependent protease with chaperone function
MIRRIIIFFDKLEDHVREHLSRYPIIYTIVGGVAIVLFWRGVWHTADMLKEQGGILGFLFYEPISLLIVTAVLLVTGLFVSYFIGDAIILSGVKSQKKLADKTEKEVKEEEINLSEIKKVVQHIETEVHQLKKEVQHEHRDHLHHLVKEREIETKK